MVSRSVYAKCLIQTSAFEEERLVLIDQVDGPQYAGLVPSHYCLTRHLTPFAPGTPEQETPGVVAARLVENGGNTAWIYLPTGETILVQSGILSERVVAERTVVPVGP